VADCSRSTSMMQSFWMILGIYVSACGMYTDMIWTESWIATGHDVSWFGTLCDYWKIDVKFLVIFVFVFFVIRFSKCNIRLHSMVATRQTLCVPHSARNSGQWYERQSQQGVGGEWDGNMGLDLSIVWECIVSVRGEMSGTADFIAPLWVTQ